MPCDDCEKNTKLRGSMICPDPWASGANKDATSGGRKKSENKLLTTKARYTPYAGGGGGGAMGLDQKCMICKKQLAAGGKYCGECAHRKGVCYICGKQILDTKFYTHHENSDLPDKKMSKADILANKPTVSTKKKADKDDPVDFAEAQAARAKEQEAARAAKAEAARAEAEASEQSELQASQQQQGGPSQSGQQQQQHTGQQQQAAAAAPQEPKQLRVAGDWYELQSEDTVYYYNSVLQSTQWNAPPEFDNVEAPEPAKPPPSIEETGGWQEMTAADGRMYYFHQMGNLTTWKKPATYKL